MQPELIATGELERSIEALLFVAGEALSIDRLAKLTQSPHTDVTTALQTIAESYAERGIVLREVAGGYRFASAPSARPVVEAYLLPPKTSLSPAAMETLAIVAYLQPATKAEIEAVRGVNVDSVVATLLDRRFIAEAGRRDVVGRPLEFRTTPEFLESFGLRSLAELPPVDLDQSLELALPMNAPGLPALAAGDAVAADASAAAEDAATEGAAESPELSLLGEPALAPDAAADADAEAADGVRAEMPAPGEAPSIEADPDGVPEAPSIESEPEVAPDAPSIESEPGEPGYESDPDDVPEGVPETGEPVTMDAAAEVVHAGRE